jgi:acyl dehydratase
MHRWLGAGWISGGKLGGIKFIAPVRPGYTISIGGTITEKRVEAGKNIVQADIFVENQDGEKCVVGSAEGVLVD